MNLRTEMTNDETYDGVRVRSIESDCPMRWEYLFEALDREEFTKQKYDGM